MSAIPEDLIEGLTGGDSEADEARAQQAQRGLYVGDDNAATYQRAALDLSIEEEAALKALLVEIEQADDGFRMEEIRPALERREAWNGRQLLAWDPGERRYVDVIRQMEDDAEPDQDIPSFHTDNFFTPYGLDYVALMIASPIQTSFAPGDPDKPRDVIAAEEAERFVEWLNKQNDSLTLRRWQAFFFWTDGFAATYTRLRADKARFGSKQEPEIGLEYGELRPAGMRCSLCSGISSVDSPVCEDCGTPHGPGSYMVPPEMGLVPRVTRMLEIPKSGVVKTSHGLIEVRRSPGARLVRECGYLILSEDVPRAHAISLYPEKSDEIGNRDEGTSAEGYETSARRGLIYGGNQRAGHLITYKRAWIRPWQLEAIGNEEVRESLKEKAGDGLQLIFMGGALCEVLAESLDEHWTFRFIYPGHGSGVVAAGSATWELQQTANELLNLRVEGARQGIPALLVNNDVLDPEAFAAGRIQPGLIYQAKTPTDGGSIRDAVVATPVANLPAEVGNLENELGNQRAQQRSGLVPALWGGQAGGAGRTLGGYRLMRDQGLMRHGIPWKELEAISYESDLQAVKLYARDGYDDIEITDQGEAGEWGKSVISIDSLSGEIRIEADDDAGFPMSPAERRAAWFEYMGNPSLAPMLMGPHNESMTAENMGLRDLRFPGQDAREQQRKEIDELLSGAPIPDPMTGQLTSTVDVDVELEDHGAHAQAIEIWANSRDGAKTKDENPAGFANVKAHWAQHLRAATQKTMLVQALSMPPMPMGVPGMPPGGPAPPMPPGPPRGPVGPPIRREDPMDAPKGPGEAPGAPGLGAPVM